MKHSYPLIEYSNLKEDLTEKLICKELGGNEALIDVNGCVSIVDENF
jgi:hypothetical protein